MLLIFFTFYILLIPFYILLHEVGHGLGVVLSSNSDVHIYLGPRNEKNKENFTIGKFHFHLLWSYIGFVDWEARLNNRQRAAALAGGPVMSLLLTLLFAWLTYINSHSELHQLFFGSMIFNLTLFIATIIPVKYPRWMGGYSGHRSDGLQLLRIIKSED